MRRVVQPAWHVLLHTPSLARRSENAPPRSADFLQKTRMKNWGETDPKYRQHTSEGGFDMFRAILTLTLSLCLGAVAAPAALAQAATPISEQEAHAIAGDAYVYFYPIMSMDLSRKQSTNVEPGKEFGKGPMNMFVNVPEYPPADFKGVVRSNFDTLYSIAWLDMAKEPVVISVPNTDGRYYLLPMLDMWTDVFASPRSRTTGTRAGTFLVMPAG